MIELRLTIIEDGHPDKTVAHRIRDKDLDCRQRQRELVRQAGYFLARQIADWRDDRDGLNGDRRQELIEQAGEQP